ncbi:hypothetical protein Tco_0606814 [Tanacetum coccineum]
MLTGKWTPMNKDVGKFNAIYDQTTALSGENDDNLYTRVLALFRDKNNAEFRHRSVWLFLKDKYKWQNPESTQARRTRGQLTEDEPEMFGDDAIPRPSVVPRKTKSQRSSASSSATSSSSKNRVTDLMQEQILIDCEAKNESIASGKTRGLRNSKKKRRFEDSYFRHYQDGAGGRGEDQGFERKDSGDIF